MLIEYLRNFKLRKAFNENNKKLLKIFSWKVLENIKNGKKGWEKDIPKNVSDLIKKKKLFGYG